MCRACYDKNGKRIKGRRCPSDTNESRRLRYQTKKLQQQYESIATATTLIVPETPQDELSNQPDLSVEATRKRIHAFRELATKQPPTPHSEEEYDKWADEISSLLTLIGAGVEKLAEEKFDAPSDEEVADAALLDEERTKQKLREMRTSDDQKAEEIHNKEEEKEALTQHLMETTGADLQTQPVIMERWAVWEQKNPEDWEKLTKLNEEITSLYKERAALYYKRASVTDPYYEAETKKEKDAVYRKLMGESAYNQNIIKRRTAFKEALQEIGVVFANEEDLIVDDTSHKASVKAVRSATTYFPKLWVQASNFQAENAIVSAGMTKYRGPLKVKETKGRAHYMNLSSEKQSAMKSVSRVMSKPQGWAPPAYEADEWEKVTEEGVWVDPVNHEAQHISFTPNKGEEFWVHHSYTYSKDSFNNYIEPKSKKSWEAVERAKKIWNNEKSCWEDTGETEIIYRKPKKQKQTIAYSVKSVLTVSHDYMNPSHPNPQFRVALHEFSHRVDHAHTAIHANNSESLDTHAVSVAFRRTRAKKNNESKPSQLENSPTGEMGYKDHFPSAYMGRVYKNSPGSNEILSMGMETLFSGTQGGFSGAHNYSSDKEYKQYILGLLASSAAYGTGEEEIGW